MERRIVSVFSSLVSIRSLVALSKRRKGLRRAGRYFSGLRSQGLRS